MLFSMPCQDYNLNILDFPGSQERRWLSKSCFSFNFFWSFHYFWIVQARAANYSDFYHITPLDYLNAILILIFIDKFSIRRTTAFTIIYVSDYAALFLFIF